MTIRTDKYKINQLKKEFKTQKSFKTKDITVFFKKFEPNIKSTTINWRIYHLIKEGVLERVGRGEFKLNKMKYFLPETTSKHIAIYRKIKTEFPYLTICVWNISILNEFCLHQSNQNYLLVEVEKEAKEAVFYYLQDKNTVFLDPTEEFFERYIHHTSNVVLVKSLISEAPTQKIKEINTIALEKMLVDVFCDKKTFFAYQGREMQLIYKEAFTKYSINRSQLFRYASRRGKKTEIMNYIKTNLSELL
jgi:hypothetical protein